jgi:hypothetical protein
MEKLAADAAAETAAEEKVLLMNSLISVTTLKTIIICQLPYRKCKVLLFLEP